MTKKRKLCATSSLPLGAGVSVDFFCLQSSSISAYLRWTKNEENTNCRPALAWFDKTLPASPLSKGVLSNKVSPIFGFFQPMFQVMIIKCIKNQVHQRRTIYWQSRSPDERWISYWKDKWIKPFENCSSYAAWFLKETAVFFHQEDKQSGWTNMFS